MQISPCTHSINPYNTKSGAKTVSGMSEGLQPHFGQENLCASHVVYMSVLLFRHLMQLHALNTRSPNLHNSIVKMHKPLRLTATNTHCMLHGYAAVL